jgi:hypothetical protein
MTRQQLQDALGFQKAYTNKLIGKGMPTTSVEDARKWLEEHQVRGKPGVRSKGAPRTAALVLPVEGDSTLADAVSRLQGSERAVSARINEVTAELQKISDNDEQKKLSNQLADLRGEQKQIVTALAKAENDLVKLQKARGQLISIDDAKALVSKALASAITALKRIPQSGQNPDEQNRLAGIVDAGLAEIYRTAQEFVAGKEEAGV